ncbi:MAG TPA: UPF0182 family protein [Jatrophihabitans sp.]|uniref:UPF0182 family membrane protein n=1 Tax=Jatrophihabitans sp. TaxID=1932789 RepID=UPI002E02492D|nr:UPF0182 family protein [Jatrophihabitans sp.]
MPSMILSRRAKIALSVVGILIVLLIVLVNLSGVYINYLWFGELGHRGVYSTVLWTKVVLFLVFGALMALIIGGNLILAYRIKPPFRPMSPEQQNLQNYVLMVEPRRKLVLGVIMVISFLAAGASAQGNWQIWQLFLHGGAFGVKDPQFGRDISFYAWDYPLYRTLLGFGFTAIIFSILLSIGIHYLSGAIRLQTPGPKITISARRHLTVLVFVFMALKAVAYWLDRYGFVFSSRSKFTGASYTDVHSALPAKTILFWIAIILAVGVLASIWLRSALLPGIGFIVLMVLSILISGIYPAIVQSVSVNPNASDKEAPYIKRNITATRQGYDIVSKTDGGTVDYQQYAATSTPQSSALSAGGTTVQNIRILDPNVVGPTFTNAQKIAQPYAFSDTLNVDRYSVGNVVHDYVVGAREFAPASLTGSLNTWINQYTVYTHGYGFVAARADTDVTSGRPSDYTEGDIPPAGPKALTPTVPQVYYGQQMNEYSIVGAKGSKREYDGNGNTTTYTGKGGVSLSSPLAKLAFAVNYKETNFLLNDAVSADGAKIIFVRDPKKRVEKVAPFLTVDGDPYPIVDQSTGHIVWMVDGYTTMADYPYSERQSLAAITGTSLSKGQKDTQINYIRNSVKATVDAYDGTVKLYAWDSSDPVLKAWRSVFPGLVQPVTDMPSTIRAHVRYPQDLFNVQRSLLSQYHINDPVASYNGRGKWAVPPDPFQPAAGNQPAFYVLADPPGSTSVKPQFQLTSPMVVNNSSNLAAYLSVNSDYGPDYGQLTVLQVPPSTAVQGPTQVANVFKTKTVITRDINLLDTGQSRVIHGNLLTLPLGESFLYVEPLYVQSSFPTLQRVLVTYGDKIGYGATLEAALADIVLGRDAGSTVSSGQTTTTPPTSGGSSTPPPTSSAPAPTSGAPAPSTAPPPAGTVQGLLAQIATAHTALNSAYDTHDPVRIAEAQAAYDKLINQLLGRLSASVSPSKSPARPSASPSK